MPHSLYSFWLVLGILGIWIGFPNAVYHLPIMVLLYPLSLFLIGLSAKNHMDALRKGWLLGLLGSSAALYWLAIPIHNVGKLPWPLAIPCALAIGAYVGFYAGLFSLASSLLKRYMPHTIALRCLALACIWYGLEYLRGILFTGFSWLQLSTAFVPWPIMLQAASIVGGCILSGIYVFATLLLAEAVIGQKHSNMRMRLGGMGILCTVLPIIFGVYTLYTNPIMQKSEQDIAFIMTEGNIDQNIKWEPDTQSASLKIYEDLTRQAVNAWHQENTGKQKAIIIWPETAMPFFLEHHKVFTPRLMNFVNEMQLPLIVGAPGIITHSAKKREIFNRAYLLNPKGYIGGFYDKMHLVPFGEYVPSWLLINFLESLLQGVGNFTQGKQITPIIYEELALGMLICYESIFPSIARQRVEQGANIFINISNDGWFGDSSAPEQHLQLAMLRSIEQGRFLVRSTNTGISAIVDDFGRLILKGSQFSAKSLTGYAQIKNHRTIFFHLEPWLPLIILIIFLGVFFYGKRKLRKR